MKHKKTASDIQLDKIKQVRVTNEDALNKYHLKGLDVVTRYSLSEKTVNGNRKVKVFKKPSGKIIESFDLRQLIHKKMLTVVCL